MGTIKVKNTGTTVTVGNNDKVIMDINGGGTVTVQADAGSSASKIELRFGGDNESDHATVDLSTFNQNGLQIDVKQYDPSDKLTLEGAFDFYLDPNDPSEYHFKYIGSDGNTYTGYVNLKDGGEKDFTTNPPPLVICFAKGSLIEMEDGYRPVEDIRVGDLVRNQSGELVPVRWVGSRTLDTVELIKNPQLQPITIREDAYGSGVPFKDLTLSPQHRVKVSDWRTELLFGESSILLPVKYLVDGHKVIQRNVGEVTYYHLMFDQHEMLTSNGLISESLHPGDVAKISIGPEALTELTALFPALMAKADHSQTAAPVLKRFEGVTLESLVA